MPGEALAPPLSPTYTLGTSHLPALPPFRSFCNGGRHALGCQIRGGLNQYVVRPLPPPTEWVAMKPLDLGFERY